MDEILESVSFALARHPERYHQVPGTSLSVIKTACYRDAPSIRIFFTYTDDEVHLVMIEFCEDVLPSITYEESLLSGYKSNRMSCLAESSKSFWESGG
jgi:hypothetical protein